ncbi:MAG: futalosine hydrolase [Phycisphaerales bacterium]
MTAPSVTLFVAAAPAEGLAVARALDPERFADKSLGAVRWRAMPLSANFDLVITGVGKANAAAAVARVFDPARHATVINIGVAGALPRSKLALLDVVVADPSVYADEGVRTPERFIDMAKCGFAPNQGIAGTPSVAVGADAALRDRLVLLLSRGAAHGVRPGPVATVSTCSGRNGIALRVVRETGAIAEAMEGAAVGFTVMRLNAEALAAAPGGTAAPFAEVRVISNTTGNRARQRWDLEGALTRLSDVVRAIARTQ